MSECPKWEDVERIAEENAVRWKDTLELLAQGPCDGCPQCARDESNRLDHEED